MAAYRTIHLDRERRLRFRPSNIRDFENIRDGSTILEALQRRSVTDLAAFLWAGMKKDDSTLSLSKVTELLDDWLEEEEHDLNDIWNVVGESLLDSGIIGRRSDRDQPGKEEAL